MRIKMRPWFIGLVIWMTGLASVFAIELSDFYTISRTEFYRQYASRGRSEFCKEDSPYSKCFSISGEECRRTFQSSLLGCQSRIKIPVNINFLVAGNFTSVKVTECIAKSFFAKQNKKFLKVPLCKVRETWYL